MVRVGGGWVALDEFLLKNDPCRGMYFSFYLHIKYTIQFDNTLFSKSSNFSKIVHRDVYQNHFNMGDNNDLIILKTHVQPIIIILGTKPINIGTSTSFLPFSYVP